MRKLLTHDTRRNTYNVYMCVIYIAYIYVCVCAVGESRERESNNYNNTLATS